MHNVLYDHSTLGEVWTYKLLFNVASWGGDHLFASYTEAK